MWDGRVTPAASGQDGGCRHVSQPRERGDGEGAGGACRQRDVHREGGTAAVRRPKLPPCVACAELGTVDDGHLAGISGETRGGDDTAWTVGGEQRHERTRVQRGGGQEKAILFEVDGCRRLHRMLGGHDQHDDGVAQPCGEHFRARNVRGNGVFTL